MKPLQIKPENNRTPTHVAIIMDGNGRWAQSRGLPRIAGHRQGAEAVRRTVKAARTAGVRYLTLYGFSLENWKRPSKEVSDLMGLLRLYLQKEVGQLHQEGVRIRFIGDRKRLEPEIVSLIEGAEQKTVANVVIDLIIALSYGSRQEITAAARQLAKDAAAGQIDPADIDEQALTSYLFTADFSDPDLIIRTSGEQRISNFMLWQAAYAELIFLDVLWPDFSEEDFASCIDEFGRRERRYGATTS